MGFHDRVVKRACDIGASILLPESGDERVLQAAETALEEGIAGRIVLLGEENDIKRAAAKAHVDPAGFDIHGTSNRCDLDAVVDEFYQLRKHRGFSREQAQSAVEDPLVCGALMVRRGIVDGMVAGAVALSADVLRIAITILGPRKGYRFISTCAVMTGFDERFGAKGEFIFADVSMGADMTAEHLADVVLASSLSEERFIGAEPRVAMLSFSTRGSARHRTVDMIRQTMEMVLNRRPDLIIDGELQFDAAVDPEVMSAKCADSPVEGRANVFIFPDLNTANVSVKVAGYLGGGHITGPIIQGLARPLNDLSRGCTAAEIVNMIAVTAVQSEHIRAKSR